MHRIWAIAENTFKEGLRQRILLLMVVFSVILILLSLFLEPFALGESPKILRDLGLAVISLFGILVVIIIGSGLVWKDIERRTIYTIITKPVKRSEIILGKFFGLLSLIVILEVSMAAIHQFLILVYEGKFDPAMLIALPFSLIEVMVVLGILLLFSSYSSPALSAIMGIIFYLVGQVIPDLKLFAEGVRFGFIKYLAYGLYYILPNLANFNFRLELVHKLPLQSAQILFSICYGLIYTIFLIYLAVVIFEKKEFK